jgi:hypothetical protein
MLVIQSLFCCRWSPIQVIHQQMLNDCLATSNLWFNTILETRGNKVSTKPCDLGFVCQ